MNQTAAAAAAAAVAAAFATSFAAAATGSAVLQQQHPAAYGIYQLQQLLGTLELLLHGQTAAVIAFIADWGDCLPVHLQVWPSRGHPAT